MAPPPPPPRVTRSATAVSIGTPGRVRGGPERQSRTPTPRNTADPGKYSNLVDPTKMSDKVCLAMAIPEMRGMTFGEARRHADWVHTDMYRSDGSKSQQEKAWKKYRGLPGHWREAEERAVSIIGRRLEAGQELTPAEQHTRASLVERGLLPADLAVGAAVGAAGGAAVGAGAGAGAAAGAAGGAAGAGHDAGTIVGAGGQPGAAAAAAAGGDALINGLVESVARLTTELAEVRARVEVLEGQQQQPAEARRSDQQQE